MKKYLFISLVSLFLTTASNAQFPITPDRSYTVVETLYSADAEKLALDWVSDDFFLDEQGRYSTGAYPHNANLLTKSPPIELPALKENQKIILQVKGFFMTEYIFDFIQIFVSTNGGDSFKRIAIRTGRVIECINWNEDFDLSEFADSEIIISFNLRSDDDYEDEGISLDFIHVIVTQPPGSVSLRTEKTLSEKLLLYPNPAVDVLYLNNKEASISVEHIEVYDVSGHLLFRQQGDRDAVNVNGLSSGIYYLRVKDTNGNTYNQPFVKK